MPDWLSQALVSQLAWEILCMLGMGALLTLLKRKWPEYANSVLFGLVGATCVAVLWFTFTGKAFLAKAQPETTPENIDANIRSWADALGIGIQRQPTTPQTYFTYLITLRNGTQIVVARPMTDPGRLQFTESIFATPLLKDMMAKLSNEQASTATVELELELARLNIGVQALTQSLHPTAIGLIKNARITATFDKDMFQDYLDEMDTSRVVCETAWTLAIEHNH
jgi:hypothetical protein